MSDESRHDAAADQLAAYVHVPFCRRRCPYCDFAVVDLAAQLPNIDRYVAAVGNEIAMEGGWGPISALNFGGGTPSALTSDQLAKLRAAISDRFGLEVAAEVSIEANPEDWTPSYAAALREIGFNRVSLGVQSFDRGVLKALGRHHTPADARTAVGVAVAAGFEVVNVDLIFGTPGESFESWQKTVSAVLELEINHLSAYALTVERGTALSRYVDAGGPRPDPDDQANKYEHLVEAASKRFQHYEVSNWAAPGRECRYNCTTWAQGEYVAFGLGAHSHRDGERRRNVRRLEVYLDEIEASRRPLAGSEKLTAWERDRERVFLGVRRRSGVALGHAGSVFMSGPAATRLRTAGVIQVRKDRLLVVDPLLTDAVAREVLATQEP